MFSIALWYIKETVLSLYCYTVGSASSVCPSVCLWRCALWLSWSVYRAKGCSQRVPSMQVPICPFRHFCCRMYRFATKRTEINEWKKRRTWVFLRQTICVRWSCYVLLFWTVNFGLSRPMVTLEWIEFGCVHKFYPEESDCILAVRRPKLVTKTGLIVRQL